MTYKEARQLCKHIRSLGIDCVVKRTASGHAAQIVHVTGPRLFHNWDEWAEYDKERRIKERERERSATEYERRTQIPIEAWIHKASRRL
jgi:hypothetical protein